MARYGHCKDCRAFNTIRMEGVGYYSGMSIAGYCNRVPPVVVINLTTDNKHPMVSPEDGCWEFLQKPKKKGKKS